MKCVSLPTWGIGIGAIIIFGFTLISLYVVIILCHFSLLSEEDKQEHKELISTSITPLYAVLVVCLMAIILSSFLIQGIVQRRPKLMKPWIYVAIAGIVCQGLRTIVGFVVELSNGLSFDAVVVNFFFGLLLLALQWVTFYTIYRLYKRFTSDMANEPEQAGLNNTNEDNPPSYSELERNNQLR
ncbi:hypothetical protein DOY81_000330 [Sarcophaga bullata]|nr:hypothetical protein DOY81_000330 [Sarcophaga bullata]